MQESNASIYYQFTQTFAKILRDKHSDTQDQLRREGEAENKQRALHRDGEQKTHVGK